MAKPTPQERERIQELHVKIQTLCAGEPIGIVFGALQCSMGAVVGVSSVSIEDADRTADLLAEDFKEEVRINWAYLQKIRCGIVSGANAAGQA